MGDQPDIKYRIVTEADMAGVEKFKEGTRGAAGATEEAGEKFAFSGRELRALSTVMGRGIPGASELMRAAMMGGANASMGSIFLLIGGIQMLESAVKKLNAEEEESRQIEKDLSGTDEERKATVDKVRDALEEAGVAEAVWLHKTTQDTRDAIDKFYELAAAIIKAKDSAGQSADSAFKSAAGKEIEDMEKRGVMSHAAALKAKEDLDIAYEQAKMLRQMAMDIVEQRNVSQQRSQKESELDIDKQNETKASATYQAALKAQKLNEGEIETGKKSVARGTKAKDDLAKSGVTDETAQQVSEAFQKIFSSAMGKAAFAALEGDANEKSLGVQAEFLGKLAKRASPLALGAFGMLSQNLQEDISGHFGPVGQGMAAVAGAGGTTQAFEKFSLYDQAQMDIKGGQNQVAKAEERKPGLDIAADESKADLEMARSQIEKVKESVVTQTDKLKEMSMTDAIKEAGLKQDLGLGKASSALTADRATAEDLGTASDDDKRKMIADVSRIEGHTVDLQTAAQIIENGANNLSIFMNQLSALSKAMGKFTPEMSADLQLQIDELVAQMQSK